MHIGTARVGYVKEGNATSRIRTSTIVNELGNNIYIAASCDDTEVCYHISGPDSVTENRITILEAVELITTLADVLGLPLIVQAPTVT